ncbi:MAG: ABC transporter permease [Methanothrix sp.]|uniref:ABC transporter permease n=2 Tax=Methanothrix sp. TaxID=90426 RepID=UPI0025DDC87E|nr:FtsX-like permease family protein [Methanothrix sp.]MBK7385792.1 ABC transporter permease [Methanothrix sp.]
MFELDIALRHMLTNRRGTAFTLLSVAIAVAIIIMSLGMTESVSSQIIENTVNKNPHILVGPKEGESYINMYRSLSSQLRSHPGVSALSPRLVGQGAARFQDNVQSVEFVGVNPGLEDQLMKVQQSAISGDFSQLRFNKRGAFLGSRLAQNLNIREGGDFHLHLKNDSLRLKVMGIMEKGTIKDQTLVYISLDTAQELLEEGDVVTEIGVRLSDYTQAPAMAREWNEISQYEATSWQDFSPEIARFVGNQGVTNILFYMFIFLISAFVIANTTIMVVSKRKREIGILMAMGTRRRSILMIFLLENVLISLPAGALGAALGYAAARAIALLPMNVTSAAAGDGRIVIDPRPEYFALALLFALSLNLISGLYPAYSAASLDPVEAIGSE